MASGLIPGITAINNQLIAPPGTRLPFNNAAPPLGWTQEVGAAFNDTSMRMITGGTGGATGGSTAWSGWNFGGTFSNNNFTISAGQLPAHSHNGSGSGTTGTSNQSLSHNHSIPGSDCISLGSGPSHVDGHQQTDSSATTNFTDLSGHNHNFSYSFTTDGGNGLFNSAISTNYTTPQVKYTDFCIGIKA